MKRLLIATTLLLTAFPLQAQIANRVLNSQAIPTDTSVYNFIYIDTTAGNMNRIWTARTSSLKIKARQLRTWWPDTMSTYTKKSVMLDSANSIRTTINSKLTKTDTTGKWRSSSWMPSSGDLNSVYGYTPYNATLNPNGFISSYTETDPLFNTKFSGKSTTDLSEGTNLYYTNGRARGSISLTITGSTGAATYNNSTGTLNIPNYIASTPKRQENYSGSTNGSGVYTVTFGTVYSSAPNIQASITNQSATNQFIRVSSVSTTGFIVNVFARASLTVLGLDLIASATTNVSGATVDVLVTEK